MAFKPLTVNTPIGKKAHILAEDDAALYDGIFGEDCVLKLGEQFASKTISNNVIRVMDGVVVVGGHVGRIIKGDYEDMMIDNGVSGQKRNDLIVARFKSGGTGGADTYSLVVVKGTPGATAKDPAIVREDLYARGKQRDYPLYRVRIENLSVVGVDKLFKVNRNFKVLAEELDKTGEKIDSVEKTLEERTNGKVKIYSDDAEGGHVIITSKDDVKWSFDAVGNALRLIRFNTDGSHAVHTIPYTSPGGTIGTVEQINKKMDKHTVVDNVTTTVAGTVLDGRVGKRLNDSVVKAQSTANTANSTANTINNKLSRATNTLGSAYGVTAKYRTNEYMTTVYFYGQHVGASLGAYSFHSLGVLPAGKRPLNKIQVPCAGVAGLYLTVDGTGMVCMYNETPNTLSFGKTWINNCITFVN